jgi:hypothetical protein
LSSISASEDEVEITGEAMRCIVTGGEENSIGLKCGSIEGTGGGLER